VNPLSFIGVNLTMPAITSLFNTGQLLPHGFCINWSPALLWLYVVSDALIVIAYYSIPITIAYFVFRRKDLQFRWIFLLFGAFILACGTTHLLGIITLWKPIYWLDASMKAVTAALSVSTAIVLIFLIPRALKLPSPAQLEQEMVWRLQAYKDLKASKTLLVDTIKTLETQADQRMHELTQRESDQRSLLEAIPDDLFELGLDGYCYSAHSPQLDFLVGPPDDLVGKTVKQVLSPEAANIVISALHEANLNGLSQGKQIELHLPQGSLWFELSVSKKTTIGDEKPRFIVLSRNITQRKLNEINLRIAATAFESQEGLMVTNANNVILRVNQAFSSITGYSAEEAVGQKPQFLSSGKQDAAFYDVMWNNINTMGKWEGELWDKRKNGEVYPQRLSITAVVDHNGRVSNYVASMMDVTEVRRNEVQRIANEVELRNALVREVHHRIKNNLQGVTGVLSQFIETHPELTESLNQVVSQIQSIGLIHGLQGGLDPERVSLKELTVSIASVVSTLWKRPVTVEFDRQCNATYLSESEAVPIALVLNELITNATKHGKQDVAVNVTASTTVDDYGLPIAIQLNIVNAGKIPTDFSLNQSGHFGTGLQLAVRLLPRSGVMLNWAQKNDKVTTSLTLHPPVIQLNADIADAH
jgi:PAS domain S-box-containing protein